MPNGIQNGTLCLQLFLDCAIKELYSFFGGLVAFGQVQSRPGFAVDQTRNAARALYTVESALNFSADFTAILTVAIRAIPCLL